MENKIEENVGVDFGPFGFVDLDDLDEILTKPGEADSSQQGVV
jgi:hypothetical protein